MKKLFFFLAMIGCIVHIAGCAAFSQQPVFIDITGNDVHPVKLVKSERTENNEVQLYFAGQTELLNTEIFMPKTEKTADCTVEPLSISEDTVLSGMTAEENAGLTAFTVRFAEPVGIGEIFILRGSVSDGLHSVLDFALPFEGANTCPAKLRMTEIRPLYSSKPKSEFIEFMVMESGNLAGITITNVGDKKNPHYTFPVAEVSKGEVIVFHWRSVEEGICDEVTKKTVSGGTQATKARDFWGPYKSIPKRNANVILIRTHPNGEIQDAILYCTEKEFQKRGTTSSWNDENLTLAAAAATASGVWQGKPELSGAVITALTASKSLARSIKKHTNTPDSWILRDTKAVTMGIAD